MAIVGSAQVRISPSGVGFAGQLRALLEKNRAVAQTAGRVFGEEYGKGINQGLTDALRGNSSVLKRAADDISSTFTSQLGKNLQKELPDTFDKAVKKSMTKSGDAAEVGGRNNAARYRRGFGQGLSGDMGIAGAVQAAVAGVSQAVGSSGSQVAGSFQGGFAQGLKGIAKIIEDGCTRDSAGTSAAMSRLGRGSAGSFSQAFDMVLNSGVGQASKRAYESFAVLWSKGAVGGVAMTALGGAISSIIGSLFALASAAVQAGAALGGGLAVGIAAAIQGGAALAVAFKGIAKAIGAGFKSADAAGKKSSDAAIANARRIEDARRRLAEVGVRNAERLADAERKVAEAARELEEANLAVTAAQDRLNRAYADGLEELEDLQFAAEDAVLSQERAALRLEEARAAAARAHATSPAGSTAVREADLALKEAELAMRMSTDRVEDYQKALEEAAQTGVEGTSAVIDAQNDLNRAREAAAKAEEAQAQANLALERTKRDNARDLADAQRDLARAYEDAARSQSEAAKAANEYNEALKSLSDSGKEFVKGLVALKPRLTEFKKAVQEGFFSEFNNGFFRAVDILLPGMQRELTKTAGFMAYAGEEALNAAARVGQMGDKYKDVANLEAVMMSMNKVLSVFSANASNGHSIIDNFTVSLGRLLVAAEPITTRFVTFVQTLSVLAEQKTSNIDGMTAKFNEFGDTLSLIWDVVNSLGSLLMTLGGYAKDAATSMLEYFRDSFDDMNKSAQENGDDIKKWFDDMAINTQAWLDLLGAVAGVFLRLGSSGETVNGATGETTTQWAETARILKDDALPVLEEILNSFKDSGPDLANLVTQALELVNAFADSKSIESFIKTLDKILGVFTWIAETPLMQFLLDKAGPAFGVLKAITVTFMGIAVVGRIFLGSFLKVGNIAKTIFTGFKNLPGALKTVGNMLTPKGRARNKAAKAATAGTSPAVGKGGSNEGVRILSPLRAGAVAVAMAAGGAATAGAANKQAASGRRAAAGANTAIPVGSMAAGVAQYGKAGQDAGEGFINGLKSKFAKIKSTSTEAMSNAVSSAKSRLKSKSPSLVFADIGMDAGTGFSNGMKAAGAQVRTAASAMSGQAVAGARAGLGGMASAGAAASAGIRTSMAGASASVTAVGAAGRTASVGMKVLGAGAKVAGAGMRFMMGPFMWIMLAVELLLPLFKKFYQENEGFRNLVDKVWGFMQTAMQAVWDIIVGLFNWVKENWPLLLAIITGPIGLAILFITKNWDKIKEAFIGAWNWLKDTWSKVTDMIKEPVNNAINWVKDKVTGIKDAFTGAWGFLKNLWTDVVKPKWDGFVAQVKEKIGAVKDIFWNDKKDGILNKIVGFFGDMWSTAWSNFKGNVNKYIIDNINDLLIANINKITGLFNLTIGNIPRLAQGGPVTGPGGPTADRVPALLSNGEYVIKASSVQKYGPSFLNAVNSGKYNGTGGWFDTAKSWMFEKTLGSLYHEVLEPRLAGWRAGGFAEQLMAGVIDKIASFFLGYGKKRDEEESKKAGPSDSNPAPERSGGPSAPKLSGTWYNPVKGPYHISRIWHVTRDYPRGYWAIDMAGPVGTPIRAINSGVVQQSYFNQAVGWMVILEHINGIRSLYAHLKNRGSRVGTSLGSGNILGYRGNTGRNTTGPHLHMEIIRSGQSWPSPYNYNPKAFLAAQGVRLATGGVVRATPGGVMAMLAEGGKHERVEPLDARGMSARDYAMIEAIMKKTGGGRGNPVYVRVFIGERELKDIVRYEVADNNRVLARDLSVGRRG